MKSDFRQRAFLPLVIPLAILATIAAVVVVFALVLTHLPEQVGNIVAILSAAAILGGIGLAASQDSLEPLKRVAVGIAVVVPLVFGGVLAVGGVCDDEGILCPSEFEPAVSFPAWAPVVVSTQPAQYDDREVTLPTVPPEDATELAIVFDNQSGISHNLYLVDGQDRDAEPFTSEAGEPAITPTYTAGEEAVFFLPPVEGEYLYYCSIHDGMDGLLTVAEGAQPAVGGEPVATR